MNSMEIIRSKGDLAEFLTDMGYTSRAIAGVIGVNREAMHNWRTKYYRGYAKRANAYKPMLVCGGFTFENTVDPRTTKEYECLQEETDVIRSAISQIMPRVPERIQRIVKGYLEGGNFAEIGLKEGLTRERIRQICYKFVRIVERRLAGSQQVLSSSIWGGPRKAERGGRNLWQEIMTESEKQLAEERYRKVEQEREEKRRENEEKLEEKRRENKRKRERDAEIRRREEEARAKIEEERRRRREEERVRIEKEREMEMIRNKKSSLEKFLDGVLPHLGGGQTVDVKRKLCMAAFYLRKMRGEE